MCLAIDLPQCFSMEWSSWYRQSRVPSCMWSSVLRSLGVWLPLLLSDLPRNLCMTWVPWNCWVHDWRRIFSSSLIVSQWPAFRLGLAQMHLTSADALRNLDIGTERCAWEQRTNVTYIVYPFRALHCKFPPLCVELVVYICLLRLWAVYTTVEAVSGEVLNSSLDSFKNSSNIFSYIGLFFLSLYMIVNKNRLVTRPSNQPLSDQSGP